MKNIIAHIRASLRKAPKGQEGYLATLNITETKSGKCYRIKTQCRRQWPKDAIYDGMQEAQELAERNGYKFKPTFANAGDVYQEA